MHIHILGICGTFMAGIAEIAVTMGHRVSGCDENIYPPMSTFLNDRGIAIHQGYDTAQFAPRPDLVIIGNALSRGNAAVEYVLNEGLLYCSGPQWLAENVLKDKHVIAVSGTHGKTTTTSLIAFILSECGIDTGYLVGGIAPDLARPARLGADAHFVIEADEYDTAFFDKRSKFVHYRPTTLIINNLEFDHADIFVDLDAIKTQFNHLLRTVPGRGTVIYPRGDVAIDDVLARGCWSKRVSFGEIDGANWRAGNFSQSQSTRFTIEHGTLGSFDVASNLPGKHNAMNISAALIAAREAGVELDRAIAAVAKFNGVKRRLEIIAQHNGITVYDDFAHHPTAIAASLAALRAAHPQARLIAVLEPRSNTMRAGIHAETLGPALDAADASFVYAEPTLEWDVEILKKTLGATCHIEHSVVAIAGAVAEDARDGDHVVIMSNGGFGGIHAMLIEQLKQVQAQ